MKKFKWHNWGLVLWNGLLLLLCGAMLKTKSKNLFLETVWVWFTQVDISVWTYWIGFDVAMPEPWVCTLFAFMQVVWITCENWSADIICRPSIGNKYISFINFVFSFKIRSCSNISRIKECGKSFIRFLSRVIFDIKPILHINGKKMVT